MHVDELTRGKIAAEIASLSPESIGHINYEGVRHKALPLYGTIGEVWLLRPDGSLWRSDADSNLELEQLPQEFHSIALVAGVRRYPWLMALLPKRPAKANDCENCDGRGMFGPKGELFCHVCGALGWTV